MASCVMCSNLFQSLNQEGGTKKFHGMLLLYQYWQIVEIAADGPAVFISFTENTAICANYASFVPILGTDTTELG